MRCTDPYTQGGEAYPCGRCPLCRNGQAGKWKCRIALEKTQWDQSAFLTLTLRPEEERYVSDEKIFPTLVKRDAQLFMKRLRERVPQKLRAFVVGEYGGKTFRPHYHVGLFNFPNCERGETLKRGRSQRCVWAECCGNCRLVGETWGKGDIEIRDLDAGKCEYLSGYIAQKRVKKTHAGMFGLEPEFSLPSRGGRGGAGGIGVGAVGAIAATIAASLPKGALLDVPGVLHHGKDKKLFLDRYLKQKLRECFELEPNEELAKARWKEQVFPVCAYARGNGISLKKAFELVNQPYEEALLARQKRKGKI